MEKFWSLANINVYKILCPPKLRGYDKVLGKRYLKEDVIYFENNEDHNIYLVSGGRVKLINYDENGNEIIRQIITRGGLFGESLILGDSVRSEFAVSCDNNTAICSMNLDSMRDLMRKNNNFSSTVYKLIGWKIKKIERRLDLLVGKDVKSRIASYIHDRYKEEESLNIPNYLSQKEMASLLAASRESINKTYKDFRDHRVVDVSRKQITILDLASLKEISERSNL